MLCSAFVILLTLGVGYVIENRRCDDVSVETDDRERTESTVKVGALSV